MYLNCHTYYSICYGTLTIAKLIELAVLNNCKSIVLTDINSTSACVDFVRQARKTKLKPIVGIDFRNGAHQQFIAVAKNNAGFQEINGYLSHLLHTKSVCPPTAPKFENTVVIYPFFKEQTIALGENEFIGVRISDLPYIRLKQLNTDKYVVLQTVTFQSKRDFNAHRLLRAIDSNLLLSKLPKSNTGELEHQMMPVESLLEAFAEFPKIIENTQLLLAEATIDFDFSPTRLANQHHYTGSAKEDWKLLKQLCAERIEHRYSDMNETIRARVEKELSAIREMNFVAYFLINWDIVTYARSKGYFYVGRGSGANSVIAYILRITDVDPIELDLYFERFINAFRTSPPDFDIDFAWTDRDDVTRYIFERFKHVALVATYNTFKDRSVTRELGKVFGLPKEEIDAMIKGTLPASQWSELSLLVIKYGEYIRDFPSHLSIHASGIVISEQPVHHFTATFLPPKGYPTIQFDMHVAEDMGWYKFDILSQRGLSKIKDTLAIVKENQPDAGEIDIHDIAAFKKDENIKHLLRNADAIGCFYVESPAMRMLLRKLQVDSYLGLVAASSIIRPGVAKSGMMNAYIQRYRHPEKQKEAHPILLELMPETFGVMVYQEDVIKVAHYFAGLTLGEADKMRRGMSGKFRSREEFDSVKATFFSNCINIKGHSPEVTSEVWRQTESFAGYAFAKGHSASYAVESYQCLYLKTYFPIEYMVATVNNSGGFYSTSLYLYEAVRLGAILEVVCVNNSCYYTVLKEKTIFIGYHLVHSLERRVAKKIELERTKNGAFRSFEDFVTRVSISLEQVTLLIRINAFRFTGIAKRTLLWEAHMRVNPATKKEEVPTLFAIRTREYEIPQLKNSSFEDTFDQLELLGFATAPYFSLQKNKDDLPYTLAKDLPPFKGKRVAVKGYLIHIKRTTTSNGLRMLFGTFLDEKGDWIDSVHFPIIASKFPFRGGGIYKIVGKVVLEYDCVTIETEYLEKLDIIEDPRYSEQGIEMK